MSGRRFGLLVARKPDRINQGGRLTWLCDCDCGAISNVSGRDLRSGHTTSCGCRGGTLHHEVNQKLLHEILYYEAETGVFRWKKALNKRVKIGEIAGSFNDVYVVISIQSKGYRAHRLAWMFVHGKWPEVGLDHWNGNKHDNSIGNLRESNHSKNLANTGRRKDNKSGYKGVHWASGRQLWCAKIQIARKGKHLGYYDDPQDAALAYDMAAKLFYGEFARLNFKGAS